MTDAGAADAETDGSGTTEVDAQVEPGPWWRPTSDRLALWSFIAFAVAAAPLILFHFGDYHWFFRDEFEFITDRNENGWPPLLEPHGGAHLSIIPRLAYVVLWKLFGLNSYLPYQACVVALHLTAAVLIRVVMRRSGVSPWIASAVAAVFVLFGPGAQNIVWAFQIGFTGSVVYGLAHLILADHDGPIGRRDALALGFGVLAVASSGVGIPTTVAVGVAVLLRRGWRPAALHTVPLGVLVAVWAVAFDAASSETSITPSVSQMLGWLREAYIGIFASVSYFSFLALVVFAIVVVGLVLAARDAGTWREALRRGGLALGLFAGGLVFTLMTAWGRSGMQASDQARSPRYMHILAVAMLPLLALAAQEIARRWPVALPAIVLLFVVPLPFNTRAFTPEVFGRPYMEERQRILTTAPRVDTATQVPRWVQPVPDPFMGEVTIGFLLDAARAGKLPDPPTGIGPKTQAEFDVRLGLGVATEDHPMEAPSACRSITERTELAVARGDVISIGGSVEVTLADEVGRSVPFSANPFNPNVFTVVSDELDLVIVPKGTGAHLCTEP